MHYDYVFVGGGLASGLCVLALLDAAPHLRLAVVEREARLGGNHTWCFHARDVSADERRWVDPLIVQRWPGYEVRFPRRTRRLASPYVCVTSQRLHEVVSSRLARAPNRLLLGRSATKISANSVTLDDGETLQGAIVVDATGPRVAASQPAQGYQKFVGVEVEAEPPPSLRLEPILMDARLPQEDGFRFMYLLPFARDRWLLEETFFSDHPALDRPRSIRRIED
jgi:lycopene beta-cyclase